MTDHIELLEVLSEISHMCIGQLTMGYRLDANYIGEIIYEATGMTNPELNDHLKLLSEQTKGDI